MRSCVYLCDQHPNIKYWGSECIKIPYWNPLKGRQAVYIPDFIIIFEDKNGNLRGEIIEIKPMKETGFKKSVHETRSQRDKAMIAQNHAKWQAAMAFARKKQMVFRVMTEEELFVNTKKDTPKPKPVRKAAAKKKTTTKRRPRKK